jgi:hypothetical protein
MDIICIKKALENLKSHRAQTCCLVRPVCILLNQNRLFKVFYIELLYYLT